MSASSPLFRFAQLELPWRLGPPDGRYLLRPETAPDGPPSHVVVLATLGAPERRRLARGRPREAPPQPPPTPVSTARITVIELDAPLASVDGARSWLAGAGEAELVRGVAVINRTLHAYRVVTADPDLHRVARAQAIVARLGFGAGEQVADGLWSDARELPNSEPHRSRRRVMHPEARLARVLGAREQTLVCEELTLRVRLDLDRGHDREGALELLVALDAALAELGAESRSAVLGERLAELRGQRETVAGAAQAALSGPLSAAQREAVTFTLGRVEAALRARAVAGA